MTLGWPCNALSLACLVFIPNVEVRLCFLCSCLCKPRLLGDTLTSSNNQLLQPCFPYKRGLFISDMWQQALVLAGCIQNAFACKCVTREQRFAYHWFPSPPFLKINSSCWCWQCLIAVTGSVGGGRMCLATALEVRWGPAGMVWWQLRIRQPSRKSWWPCFTHVLLHNAALCPSP